jgi:glycosyltransferase involved in cell wall biosynthesis
MSHVVISALILTKNEEKDLPRCLASLSWCTDIHVFDSFSSDATVAIAREWGATITQRAFTNWSDHQNWGLRNIPFRHPWVFYVDADECPTAELSENLRSAAANPGKYVAFRVRRRDWWNGVWMRHVVASPFNIRLFRPEKMSYERIINPVSIPDGPVGEVAGYLDHFPFSKGIAHWIDRHNSYSTLEAQQIIAGEGRISIRGLFSRDLNERRRNQKSLFYRLPARPLLKFLLLYIAKRGFLDGRAGLDYALLQSFYEYLIVEKTDAQRLVVDASRSETDLCRAPTQSSHVREQ